MHWIENGVRKPYANRILPITEEIASEAGVLTAEARRQGTTPELADTLIAATARVLNTQLVPLNRKHFEQFQVTLISL